MAVGRVGTELVLLALIEDWILILPPADRPHFYDALAPETGAPVKIIRELHFGPDAPFAGPFAVMVGTRLVVCPDVFFKGRYPLIHIPENRGRAQIMIPMSPERFEQIKKQYPDRGVSLPVEVELPVQETGRHGDRR
jgi:hypothetical protein